MSQSISVAELTSDFSLKVHDPEGNLLSPGDAGVEMLETSDGISYLIDPDQAYTPGNGESSAVWKVTVEGNGYYGLHVAANSGLHLDYLGRPVLRANRDQFIKAGLIAEGGTPAVDPASAQFWMINAANGKKMQVDLFDDGQHNDSQNGDGVYGGTINLSKGLWRLSVLGNLVNGSAFERIHPTPIRLKTFAANQPPDSQQVPGNSRTIRFLLTNDDGTAGLNQISVKQYELQADSLLGWTNVDAVPASIVLAPGETAAINIAVDVPLDAEPGAVEETFLTIVENSDIGASETLTVKTTAVDEIHLYLPNIVRP